MEGGCDAHMEGGTRERRVSVATGHEANSFDNASTLIARARERGFSTTKKFTPGAENAMLGKGKLLYRRKMPFR
jgi:hypothetical protein